MSQKSKNPKQFLYPLPLLSIYYLSLTFLPYFEYKEKIYHLFLGETNIFSAPAELVRIVNPLTLALLLTAYLLPLVYIWLKVTERKRENPFPFLLTSFLLLVSLQSSHVILYRVLSTYAADATLYSSYYVSQVMLWVLLLIDYIKLRLAILAKKREKVSSS